MAPTMMRLAAVGLALGLSGCIFLLDVPSGDLDHCSFHGSRATCGSCVADKCQSYVDSCCSANACLGNIEIVERCASYGNVSGQCDDLLASTDPQDINIMRCIRTTCAVACSYAPGDDAGASSSSSSGSRGSGYTYCSATSSQCQCSVSSIPDTGSCKASQYRNGVCCRGASWPSSGTCSCLNFACTDTTTGCECSQFVTGSKNSCTSNGVCCQRENGCECYNSRTTCPYFDDTKVTSCTLANAECGQNRTKTTSCVD